MTVFSRFLCDVFSVVIEYLDFTTVDDMLVCTDFKHLDTKINEARSELKQKVNRLRDLEQKEELHGFSLNPLSKEEMAAVQNLL